MQTLFRILANATQPASQPVRPRPWWASLFDPNNFLFPLILMMVVLYVFMIRGKRSQERQRQDMLNQLKRGDRVQTIGGILGTVVDVREDEVVLKVDESSNTKMRFARVAIHRVLESDKPAQGQNRESK